MKIKNTKLSDVYMVIPDDFEDYRGSFTEVYNVNKYRSSGLIANFVQDDLSISYRNVLRGLHGDEGTYKLVACIVGRIYLVVLNYNNKSKEYGKWQSFILTEDNKRQIFIPPLFVNGYYVLSDKAVFSYKQSSYYGEYKQFSVKWNDSRFNIDWPCNHPILSLRDR